MTRFMNPISSLILFQKVEYLECKIISSIRNLWCYITTTVNTPRHECSPRLLPHIVPIEYTWPSSPFTRDSFTVNSTQRSLHLLDSLHTLSFRLRPPWSIRFQNSTLPPTEENPRNSFGHNNPWPLCVPLNSTPTTHPSQFSIPPETSSIITPTWNRNLISFGWLYKNSVPPPTHPPFHYDYRLWIRNVHNE